MLRTTLRRPPVTRINTARRRIAIIVLLAGVGLLAASPNLTGRIPEARAREGDSVKAEDVRANEAIYEMQYNYARKAFAGWVASDRLALVLQEVTDNKARKIERAGEGIAQSALNSASCSELFNLPPGVTAWSVFQMQVDKIFTPEGDYTFYGSTDDTLGNGKVTINFNTDILSTFVTSNATSAGNTIVHELIHAVAALYGLDAIRGAIASGWVNEDNTGNPTHDNAAQAANDGIVSDNCVP
jgi:hypothetical protein